MINSVPLELIGGAKKWKGEIIIRGEVVMSKTTFERLNKQQSAAAQLANPRNAAAGSVRQLDPQITKERSLDMFAFELLSDHGQKTHADSHQLLKQMGFKISDHDELCHNLDEVEQYLRRWQEKRKQLNYWTDGAVVIINDLATEKILGSVGKAERWMIAYKFPAEEATTRLQQIIFQVGRSGVITPVAVLAPVKIAGTIVSRATLHNRDEIKRLGLLLNDTVIVRKAGDIIPDVVQVITNLRDKSQKSIIWPKNCPICNSQLNKPPNEVNYYCSNKNCTGRQSQRLIFFVSKSGLDIVGLGKKIVELLYKQGFITEPSDFYKLTVADLMQLEGFAEKKATNLISAINKKRQVSLAKLITALGIRHVGQETAIAVADKFKTLKAVQSAEFADFLTVADIGPVVAQSLFNFFHSSYGRHWLDNLLAAGIKVDNHSIKSVNQPLLGKIAVVTGSLESYSRQEIKDILRQAGAKVAESVSKKTSFIVVGSDPGSKLKQAQKLGIKIIDETGLKELLPT
jgi:DNA ligase (NAD+)